MAAPASQRDAALTGTVIGPSLDDYVSYLETQKQQGNSVGHMEGVETGNDGTSPGKLEQEIESRGDENSEAKSIEETGSDGNSPGKSEQETGSRGDENSEVKAKEEIGSDGHVNNTVTLGQEMGSEDVTEPDRSSCLKDDVKQTVKVTDTDSNEACVTDNNETHKLDKKSDNIPYSTGDNMPYSRGDNIPYSRGEVTDCKVSDVEEGEITDDDDSVVMDTSYDHRGDESPSEYLYSSITSSSESERDTGAYVTVESWLINNRYDFQ